MRPEARERILALPADALVLDVGGAATPFPRADWMLDIAPYESRGTWGYDGDPGAERFSADTWVQRDVCDHEPWPFANDQFDFAICSHTLEDVRDPVWVCKELQRVARAGYVEVPSRLEEQSWGVQGEWTGWSHHHWLVEIGDGAIEFLFKPHVIHVEGYHLPPQQLEPGQRVASLWWESSFSARERVVLTAEELDADLKGFVAAHARPAPRRRLRRR